MKAVRGCEIKLDSMIAPRIQKQSDAEIKKGVARTDDQRLFHICEALRRGIMTIEEIHDITTMDVFFLHKFQNIIDMEKELAAADKIDSDLYLRAKKMGFLDKTSSSCPVRTFRTLSVCRYTRWLIPVPLSSR